MAATPKYGVATFVGRVSKQTYNKDFYVSDVAGEFIKWDGGQGASSSSPDMVTFAEPVTLIDWAIATGTADTTKTTVSANGALLGQIIRYATRLDSLATRTLMNIRFNARDIIRMAQLA